MRIFFFLSKKGQKYKEKNEEKKKDEEKPVRTVEVNVGDNIQTEDTYIFYFETRRHGGGDVEKVEIEREKGIIRVTFVKPEGQYSYWSISTNVM